MPDVVAAPTARQTEDLRAEFDQLADTWRDETAGYSLAAQYAAHPAYRRIIDMGRPALPLISERLADQRGRWYVALHAITNANPVEHEVAGLMQERVEVLEQNLFEVVDHIRAEPLNWMATLNVPPDFLEALTTLAEELIAAHERQKTESLRDRFIALTATWKEETLGSSLPDRIAMHPAYQQIIAMGEPVIPLILDDLEKTSAHWFVALHHITGARPVPMEDQGRIGKMRDAWLRWGRARGMID